jgi:hypothetical protein
MSHRSKKRIDTEQPSVNETVTEPRPKWLDYLFARRNRGLLLDVVVFVLNIFVMRILVRNFLDMTHAVEEGDAFAQVSLFVFLMSLLVLPPAGAVLKRWHFHERLKGKEYKETALAGCLFSPMFYICLMFVVMAAADAFALQYF